jgi:hypothetical protein
VADPRLAPFRGPAASFCAFLAIQAVSAAVLFALKLGGSPARVQEYYLGSEATFAAPRTITGLLETAVPHLLAVPLVLFIVAHLVAATGLLRRRVFAVLCGTSFAAALVGVLAGFAVRFVWPALSVVKLGAFLALEATLLAWIGLLALTFARPRRSTGRASAARRGAMATTARRSAP